MLRRKRNDLTTNFNLATIVGRDLNAVARLASIAIVRIGHYGCLWGGNAATSSASAVDVSLRLP